MVQKEIRGHLFVCVRVPCVHPSEEVATACLEGIERFSGSADSYCKTVINLHIRTAGFHPPNADRCSVSYPCKYTHGRTHRLQKPPPPQSSLSTISFFLHPHLQLVFFPCLEPHSLFTPEFLTNIFLYIFLSPPFLTIL